MSRICRSFAILILVGGVAMAGALDDATLSAGSFTIARVDRSAYSEPSPVLTHKQRQLFLAGRSVFHRQWASISSLNGDWGLGPTFVADRCSGCHLNTGRGHPPAAANEQLMAMLVRLSIPGADEHGGPNPHPNYGDQFQNHSLDGSNVDLAHGGQPIPAEAALYLDWEARDFTLANGEIVSLRKPKLRIENPAFGPIESDVMISLRVAQPLVGIGLLDAVSEKTLLAIARTQRANGINGRPNYVWDAVNQRMAMGRYGWKANVPNLKMQIAAAAIGDMGVNSTLYPEQNCPPAQTLCANMLPGNLPEIIGPEIDSLALWMQGLAVPARRDVADARVQRGAALFEQARCAMCHVPELKTGNTAPLPQLANQTFRAYTDLLLHDMGEGLADGRPDFQAGPRDWRTPALWGLGLSETVTGRATLLHDGRARNVSEAILWHGGEAQKSRQMFSEMSKADREALVKFVEAI
ncbi:MAG: di-heme oxidoredictase family protein [Burkholderiales bacterium]